MTTYIGIKLYTKHLNIYYHSWATVSRNISLPILAYIHLSHILAPKAFVHWPNSTRINL